MKEIFQIKYLRNVDIDKAKWDECIQRALNSRVYALSVYLDGMCPGWDALIVNDYEFVMPLTWRLKFGIHYLYQPAFTQQLGIFSSKEITNEVVDLVLKHIPNKFCYWDIALNAANKTNSYPNRSAKNYLLSLSTTYENLAENYNRNAKRNIRKAIEANVVITDESNFLETINMHRLRFKDTVGANENDYQKLENLLKKLDAKNMIYSACATDGMGTMIASSTYLLHNNRVIFLINGNLQQSLENGATHLLKDHVIKKFSGGNWAMDFEGSDFPQFAKFYEQFGAKEIEYFPVIINNKLPWPFRSLKRSTPAL